MISSQLPPAKPSTLPAGHPPQRHRLPDCVSHPPTAAMFSAFFQLLSPGFALPSPQYRPSQSLSSPIYPTIDVPNSP